MNEIDPRLLEGLRALASDGLREAPVSVETRLLGELRKRRKVARRNLWIALGSGTLAAAIAIAMLLGSRPAPGVVTPASAVQESAQADDDSMDDFYRLPDTDYLPPMESAMVVRVQLPVSSLRLMGLPVSEEQAGDSVQADVLLGQDGLARGVRLVE
jgi:hypothetical protein